MYNSYRSVENEIKNSLLTVCKCFALFAVKVLLVFKSVKVN